MNKLDLRSITEEELSIFLKTNNQPSFRIKQINEWLWSRNIEKFEDMTNLPKSLITLFNENFSLTYFKQIDSALSKDGTRKILWELADKETIETVLIPSSNRLTVCISTQTGCPLKCKFCASGKPGRNLDFTEIYMQVLHAYHSGKQLSNIVIMGMGEPLLNTENTLKAIHYITDKQGLSMSPYRITLSTVGIIDEIKKLADLEVRFNLAVSLHSANPLIRQSIMPIAKKYSLEDLQAAIRYFHKKTSSRVTIEYLLIGDINDEINDAENLAIFTKAFPCKINLIPYNAAGKDDYKTPNKDKVEAFKAFLETKNIIVNVRYSKGKDIAAACGQLAGKREVSDK